MMDKKSRIINSVLIFFASGIITHQIDLAFPCDGCKLEPSIVDNFFAWFIIVVMKGGIISFFPFIISFLSKKYGFKIFSIGSAILFVIWNLITNLN